MEQNRQQENTVQTNEKKNAAHRAVKGQYGYRSIKKRQELLLLGLLAAAILLQLFARSFVDTQAFKNVLTVMAILTVLPLANLASPFLASWNIRSAPESFHRALSAYEDHFPVLYDLILTTKEEILPMDGIVIHPTGIYGFCSKPKAEKGKGEQAVNALLKANRLDPNFRLICEEKQFFKRIESLKPVSEYEDDGSMDYAEKLLKNLSM